MKALRYTPQDIGRLIREIRKDLGVTQKKLALTSSTGLRFIIELEKGKETAEIGKVLTVLQTLGIQLTLTPPAATKRGYARASVKIRPSLGILADPKALIGKLNGDTLLRMHTRTIEG